MHTSKQRNQVSIRWLNYLNEFLLNVFPHFSIQFIQHGRGQCGNGIRKYADEDG